MSKPFVNPVELPTSILDHAAPTLRAQPIEALEDTATLARTVSPLLAPQETQRLISELDVHRWRPVGLDGIADHWTQGDPIGSWRISSYSPALATLLWHRVRVTLDETRMMCDRTPTDWDGHRIWRPVGVNPLLRFIRYERAGLLVPHYDAPYDYGDETRRTLVTLVVYLERSEGMRGGATRFIADPQAAIPLTQRNYDDWDRLAQDREIIARVDPQPGSALLFDHRVLHDSEPLSGSGRKTIMRTDIIYEKAGG